MITDNRALRSRLSRAHTSFGRAAAVALALLSTSCGGALTAPFEGPPRLTYPGEQDTSVLVGVCYNKMFTTPAEVQSIAANSCGTGSTPQLLGQDMILACPLLTPVRATFKCVAE